jgi:3-oxoacyl-[acyl-carrier protein] reductase
LFTALSQVLVRGISKLLLSIGGSFGLGTESITSHLRQLPILHHNPEMNQAVITGAGGALGSAIVAAFKSPDWKIFGPPSADLDVCDQTLVQGYFARQSVDLLVCAAGTTCDMPLARLTESAWDEVFAVNFKGALNCARAALPGMVERRSGHIIFISSFSAFHPPVGQAAYATAKAALLGLAKDLARSHGCNGIRVNVILPGFLESRMTASVTAQRREAIRAVHLLGQFNGAHEVAKFVRHLHHDLPHTSGQVFQLDSRIS